MKWSELPQEYRDLPIDEIALQRGRDRSSDNLDSRMLWICTEQGHEFWRKVYLAQKLEDLPALPKTKQVNRYTYYLLTDIQRRKSFAPDKDLTKKAYLIVENGKKVIKNRYGPTGEIVDVDHLTEALKARERVRRARDLYEQRMAASMLPQDAAARRLTGLESQGMPAGLVDMCVTVSDGHVKPIDFKTNIAFQTEGMELAPGKSASYTVSTEVGDIEAVRKVFSKLKPKPIKLKKVFHTFKFKKRKVTIAVLYNKEYEHVLAGYSVKLPKDKWDEELMKKIAVGRAENPRGTKLLDYPVLGSEIANRHVLLQIAEGIEFKIRKGIIVIKGIKETKK